MSVGVIVLGGGTSRRWGGTDKTSVLLAGRPVLAHVLDGVLPARPSTGAPIPTGPVVVVAPAEHPVRSSFHSAGAAVLWVMEDPPGGGPAAGIAAGMAALARASTGSAPSGPSAVGSACVESVVVLAGDLPFAASAVPRLLAALEDAGPRVDAAVGVDPDGRRQPLLAAYRLDSLHRALDGDPHGRSLRSLLTALTVVEVPVSEQEAFDLDTPESLAHAETLLGR